MLNGLRIDHLGDIISKAQSCVVLNLRFSCLCIHFIVSPTRVTDLVRLQLHGAIYRSDSFVLMPSYCANLKAIRYESTSLNRIVADKSHRVIAALEIYQMKRFIDVEHSLCLPV